MVEWWVWTVWIATVCVAVWLGCVVNEWYGPGRPGTVPVRLHARHDATER